MFRANLRLRRFNTPEIWSSPMRLLLDECVPKELRLELSAHSVRTVVEMGWSGIKNGQLLQKGGLEPAGGLCMVRALSGPMPGKRCNSTKWKKRVVRCERAIWW